MIFKCSLQAFKQRRFNPEAKLDMIFVDGAQKGEGAVDKGGLAYPQDVYEDYTSIEYL